MKVSREAARELQEAVAWYEQEKPGLGRRFLSAFEHAAKILSEPYPPLVPVQGRSSAMGARKLILHRFPFSLIIIKGDHSIIVVALAHHSRLPNYWQNRLKQ